MASSRARPTLRPVTASRDIRLGDDDARVRGRGLTKAAVERRTAEQTDRIGELQRVFYADARHALLIVLQGRDASGKDGTIRKVFHAVNPQGCSVTSFGPPTELEQRHDFLWRVHQAVPPRGMIGIFNRSHYEDILVPQVQGTLGDRARKARYRHIVDFERMLADAGVVILKFMLHVSRDEQRERLQKRLDDPEKRWKFRVGDLDDRAHWDAFSEAYTGILEHTSTRHAPWFIVPADDKKVRNLLIAERIADTIEGLKPRYPAGAPELRGLEVEK